MENSTLPPEKPILLDAPPTVEYIEPKKNRKKIIGICAVVVIICIPIVISLFKIDYSVKRVYEIVNPAYIGTSPDYGTWSGIVTVAKKIIQPVIHLPNENNVITPTPTPTSTPTATPSTLPQINQQQGGQQLQGSQQNPPAQNQIEAHYPERLSPDYPTATLTPTSTPTSTPTATPPPSVEQQNYSNDTQIDAYAAYTACFGKKNEANCSYQSSYGDKINGKCVLSGGYLMCIHGQ